MADCSSLPSELVRRIAECLLDTNDLDSYMDFRAVCHSWRSATDDPSNSSDPRFCPRNWIIIDMDFETDSCLMVNTASGRVLRKDLPVLRRYYVVAVTTNGALFVLADREHPHAARVLNPFTGHMIRFTAPVPYNMKVSSAAFSCRSLPSLRLIWDSDRGQPDG
uniref:F-box domain-containing protein n=1 Tax=Triticum urartu TaxID=4572 RepID=A0A8R7U3L4_TRIUA